MDQVNAGFARALLGMFLLGSIAAAAPVSAQEAPPALQILSSFDPSPNDSGWADSPVDVAFTCDVPCDITVTISDAPYEDAFTLADDGEYYISVTATAEGYESAFD